MKNSLILPYKKFFDIFVYIYIQKKKFGITQRDKEVLQLAMKKGT